MEPEVTKSSLRIRYQRARRMFEDRGGNLSDGLSPTFNHADDRDHSIKVSIVL